MFFSQETFVFLNGERAGLFWRICIKYTVLDIEKRVWEGDIKRSQVGFRSNILAGSIRAGWWKGALQFWGTFLLNFSLLNAHILVHFSQNKKDTETSLSHYE